MIRERIDIDAGNGKTVVILKPVWDYPITRGTIILHNGSYMDKNKKGLCGVFYDLLNERHRFYEELDKKGAKIRSQNALTKSFINFAFLNSKIKKSFDLLSEFINEPEFTMKNLEIVKRKRIDKLAIMEEDPEYVISRKIQEIVYRSTPLENSTYGTKEGIWNIVLDDILGFYKDVFRNSPVDIIVVSSYRTKKIVEYVKGILDYFNGSFIEIPEGPDKYIEENVILRKENITNAYLSLFVPVYIDKEEDYLGLKLFSYILGEGSFNARLLGRLREELGLVYYASSGLSRGFLIDNIRYTGYFDVIAETGMDNIERVSIEIEKILNEMLNGKIEEDELEIAKRYYIGLERRRGETYRDILNTFLTEKIYGLERNYYKGIVQRIENIRLKELKKAVSLLREKKFSKIILEGESEKR